MERSVFHHREAVESPKQMEFLINTIPQTALKQKKFLWELSQSMSAR